MWYNIVRGEIMAKRISVIIVAEGSSNRMGMNTNKIFLDLCGRSVIERTISAFTDIPEIFEIILVTKKEFFDDFKNKISNLTIPIKLHVFLLPLQEKSVLIKKLDEY